MKIHLHDNRVGGKEASVSVETLVRKFRSSYWDDEEHRGYYPFPRRLDGFIMNFEHDGCKRFDPWTPEELDAIYAEWKNQEATL